MRVCSTGIVWKCHPSPFSRIIYMYINNNNHIHDHFNSTAFFRCRFVECDKPKKKKKKTFMVHFCGGAFHAFEILRRRCAVRT